MSSWFNLSIVPESRYFTSSVWFWSHHVRTFLLLFTFLELPKISLISVLLNVSIMLFFILILSMQYNFGVAAQNLPWNLSPKNKNMLLEYFPMPNTILTLSLFLKI